MSGCEFEQEGLCTAESKCSKQKGKLRECVAKPEDLIDICTDCYKPVNECGCGTNWILLNINGKFVPVTPKTYSKIKRKSK